MEHSPVQNKLYLNVQLLTLVTSLQADLNKKRNDIILRWKVAIHIRVSGFTEPQCHWRPTLSMEAAKDQKAFCSLALCYTVPSGGKECIQYSNTLTQPYINKYNTLTFYWCKQLPPLWHPIVNTQYWTMNKNHQIRKWTKTMFCSISLIFLFFFFCSLVFPNLFTVSICVIC